ncbi:hypothetical protein BAUCODRAFT_36174 [Baudoinia panamericana UAMH 10762]|uniref:Ketoreductase (KR) domain-containing protein n=1 Tax=Baudoinia panamericana (strain UAMH 10762) TaxID=717646 RepID=M2MB66_BAUPA|nr:uncharacterized protein BAUCODRAFT_36174 [Baudoinia panamericana UAMH 10762]EMC93726.1 hypothetical protein BAUCODRAFT_36174 [Baudoinia panamericana UAMH 10762]
MSGERKVILITGATGGIGRATALTFAKTGHYHLALHYKSASAETRDALASEVNALSPIPDPDTGATPSTIKVDFFQADLGDYDSVRKLHKDVVAGFQKIDVLFANAGSTLGHQGVKNLVDVPIDIFERTWRVNTGSAILLTQLCLPAMEAQGWGRIIFDSSVAALTGGSIGPHYASSKSAMHGFVHWLAGNVAKKGITVNAVAPAVITGTAMMGTPTGEREREMAASKYLPSFATSLRGSKCFSCLNRSVAKLILCARDTCRSAWTTGRDC